MLTSAACPGSLLRHRVCLLDPPGCTGAPSFEMNGNAADPMPRISFRPPWLPRRHHRRGERQRAGPGDPRRQGGVGQVCARWVPDGRPGAATRCPQAALPQPPWVRTALRACAYACHVSASHSTPRRGATPPCSVGPAVSSVRQGAAWADALSSPPPCRLLAVTNNPENDGCINAVLLV